MKSSYSVTELAELLGWSRYKVKNWIKNNQVPTVRVGKKKVMVLVESLFGENLRIVRCAEAYKSDDKDV